MDLREHIQDPEEVIRACVIGLMKGHWGAMPARVSEDTKDGHVAVVQPTIQRIVTDLITGAVTYEDHPEHPDNPIHYAGGGKMVATHPVKKDDEVVQIFASRCIDAWHQQGGTAQPMEDRLHSLADGLILPGIRSDPRKLQKVDPDAHHVRSVDKKHVTEMHPDTGHKVKVVDPSTAAASPDFDPFTQAKAYYDSTAHPTDGVGHSAVDGDSKHIFGLTHAQGFVHLVANALHSFLLHPSQGGSMNAANGQHSVKAHPDLGALLSAAGGQHMVTAAPSGVAVQSSSQVGINAPSTAISGNASIGGNASVGGMLGAGGGISFGGGGGDGSGGTMTSTQVGGDLAGSLPDPTVVGITHVADANMLKVATNDQTAEAAGVAIGGLYINTLALPGCALLAVRLV